MLSLSYIFVQSLDTNAAVIKWGGVYNFFGHSTRILTLEKLENHCTRFLSVDQKTKALTEKLLSVQWTCQTSPKVATLYACIKHFNLFYWNLLQKIFFSHLFHGLYIIFLTIIQQHTCYGKFRWLTCSSVCQITCQRTVCIQNILWSAKATNVILVYLCSHKMLKWNLSFSVKIAVLWDMMPCSLIKYIDILEDPTVLIIRASE